MKRILILATLAFIAAGCSTMRSERSPNFYPNDHLRQVGPNQADRDARYCQDLADEYVKDPNRFKEGAINTAEVAVGGAAAGAVAGTIVGGIGRSVAAGAAGGAVLQVLRELYRSGEKSPDWSRFAEQCLADKGYRIYGWSN